MRLYKIRVLGKNQNPRKILLRMLHYSYYSILHNTSTCTFAVNLFITSLYNRTDSLLSVINHVVPENVMPISSNQDEDEELQKDLDSIIKIDTPFDQWQIIMTQPMDEIGELKFTGNKTAYTSNHVILLKYGRVTFTCSTSQKKFIKNFHKPRLFHLI